MSITPRRVFGKQVEEQIVTCGVGFIMIESVACVERKIKEQ
jgi:hypothetical protein